MKYIKLFEELNFDRNIPIDFKTNIGNNKIEYKFFFTERLFCVKFGRYDFKNLDTKEDYTLWERSYGLQYPNGLMKTNELHLKLNKLMDLISIVSDITIDFIKNNNPGILLIKHENMEEEYDNKKIEIVDYGKMNKRSKINYQFFKNKLSSKYKISYYSYGNGTISKLTNCNIYKEDNLQNVKYLNRNNKFIM